jgi:hypothetical protein
MSDQTRREFISPIVGSGRQGDFRRPLAVLYIKRASWMMHELDDHKHCIVTFIGDRNEIGKCLNDPDIIEFPAEHKPENFIRSLPINPELQDDVLSKLAAARKCVVHRRLQHGKNK